jgi:hypothetical protein
MKAYRIISLTLLNLFILNIHTFSQKISPIVHDKDNKTITLSGTSGSLMLRVNYSNGCILDKVIVKGHEVTGSGSAVYSGIRLGDQLYSSKQCILSPVITILNNSVIIDSIKFGNTAFAIEEKWIFKINGNDIKWQINRQYLNNGAIDENYLPCWQFNSMQTWDGAMLDNGGVAWNRFLDKPGDTYGTHAATLTFWNSSNNSCLRIMPDNDNYAFRTATFSHQRDHLLLVVQSSSTEPINTKYGLKRFLRTGQNVFAPIEISKSGISVNYTLQTFDYDREYDRGILKGINEKSVNEMLNTIGRYGVVDKNLYGSNGWRTGWAVLQEPWLALFGLAIDSPDFIDGFSQTLEYERGNAIMPDGRVLPRWHHDSTDAMPNTFRSNGFYECQWGYMLDSQPAYAIDVAEQFDMTGDIDWLRKFKLSCENVLDYMIKRDSNGNGLFEVVQKTYKEQKGTDWMDVVWASYEVASINAYMYNALIRWSDLEKLLGDKNMSEKYQDLALKLKTTFNKNIADGGFWNPDKNWYVYWREKDGSIHGNNLVSMINFLAIGYGLCDDPVRKNAILSKMEDLMQKENLFIWPSCFFPYEDNVGLRNVNYPYPNYENGDLFLAWAELGTRCYSEKNPEIALKYIQNVITRYESDGLAYQRYSRLKQNGEGDDILSNNIMAVVGLYRNIYGIRPRYNRLYIEPHLTTELNGTKLNYWLRNQNYLIGLSKEKYSISANNFMVSYKYPFAINSNGNELEYFNGNDDYFSIKISTQQPCSIDIISWGKNNMSWNETGKNLESYVHYELYNLKAGTVYQLLIDGRTQKKYTSDIKGIIRFDCPIDKNVHKIQILAIGSIGG